MMLRQRLDAYSGRLTSADHAVLDVLLTQPTQSAFLTATQVARLANVHVASATRLAKKLDYTGYPQLRESLQSELLEGVGSADRILNTLAQTEPSEIFANLVEHEIAALQQAARLVSQHDLDVAVRYILSARRIRIFARGNASVLGAMLERRLRRFGFDAQQLGADGRDLAETLVSLGKNDLVFAIALRRKQKHLSALLGAAHDVGATTVLLTDIADAGITPRPELVLAAPRGSGREYNSLTVPMAIANALVLAIADFGGERTLASLKRLDVLLHTFDD